MILTSTLWIRAGVMSPPYDAGFSQDQMPNNAMDLTGSFLAFGSGGPAAHRGDVGHIGMSHC